MRAVWKRPAKKNKINSFFMKIKLDIISVTGYIYPVIEIIRLGEKNDSRRKTQERDIKIHRQYGNRC